MIVFEFLIALASSFVLDLLFAALLTWLFSVMGIPFLDALSFWQVYGVLIAFGLMYSSASIGQRIGGDL